jgi:hypothetical protein
MIMPARGSISYLVFSIVTCAESIARPTISETLLSPIFRRGSRSNHTPKLILWLGLKSSTPIARAISFNGPKRQFAALQRYVRSWNMSRHGADIVNVRLQLHA